MRTYYVENREASIARAEKWAKENPERKREINQKSNLKIHGSRFINATESENLRYAWDEFLSEYDRLDVPEDRACLCEDFIDTQAASVISIPTEVESILADHFENI